MMHLPDIEQVLMWPISYKKLLERNVFGKFGNKEIRKFCLFSGKSLPKRVDYRKKR